jgi:S-formylglutathione hydrolase FrmB
MTTGRAWTILAIALMACVCRGTTADETAKISPATIDAQGFLVHKVESAHQGAPTEIRVLLPEKLERARRYPVVYVLPVEAGREHRYGDGLVEVKRHDLANRHRAIFVAPTFSHLPWYADHPSDPAIRQESYFLHVVVPYVDKTYPVIAAPEGRLLLGFSKSGWGAWSLLIRHPQRFGRAAAWDAPMMMERQGMYGSGQVFATQENFEKYCLSRLVREKSSGLRSGKRLSLAGHAGFAPAHEKMHALLDELRIPHDYRAGPNRAHDWHSGWVCETVELLLDEASP